MQAELRILRSEIAQLKSEGLIAAKGTAIVSYKARGASGTYWEYLKLVEPGNKTLIHLGKPDSPWVALFEQAIERRKQLEALEATRAQITSEITQVSAALKPLVHR